MLGVRVEETIEEAEHYLAKGRRAHRKDAYLAAHERRRAAARGDRPLAVNR